jgi:anaerobic magnesium-protoporphyrin IX monomethyl ester cyclase
MRILLAVKEVIACERLAISCLSAILKEKGHEVRALVVNPLPSLPFLKSNNRVGTLGTAPPANNQPNPNGIPKAVYEVVKDFRPDIIGYTMMTGEHATLLELNRKLKQEFDFKAVLGGPHAQFSQDVIEEDGVDAICIGEGDIFFPQFVERLNAGEEYWKTETFHVKHEGEIYRNPLGPLVEDLDSLPDPDRQTLYDAEPGLLVLGAKAFVSARGCPYRCSYCFNEEYNKNYKDLGVTGRFRSPERVVEEIAKVKERYPLSMVSLNDDVVTLKPHGWLKEFSKLYKQKVNLPFSVNTRADNLREEDVKALSEAGLKYVWMGVETGDEMAADVVFQRDLNNNAIITACNLLRKYGVKVLALNIMGLPVKDPFEVDMRTLDLNLKIKPALASCGLLYPFPGTTIEKYSINAGFLDSENKGEFLESNKRASLLNFHSKTEKRKVENLQKLVGIIVEFPFLRPFTRILAALPLTGFYHFLFYLHLGYCHKIRLSPFKLKNSDRGNQNGWAPYLAFFRESYIWLGTFFSLLRKT